MGRAHQPTSSNRPSYLVSRTASSPSSTLSAHTPQFHTITAIPNNVIDLTLSPPIPSSSLTYSLSAEPPHYQRGSPALSSSSPTRGTSNGFSLFQPVVSASAALPHSNRPHPPYSSYSTPPSTSSRTPRSISISPTSIVPPCIPFTFPTWDTPGPSMNPTTTPPRTAPSPAPSPISTSTSAPAPAPAPASAPASASAPALPPPNPPIPRPIRRMPTGCTQIMLDVTSYPTRPGFSDFYGPDSPIPFKCAGEEGYGTLSGLSMRDALCGTGMKDPTDRVFQYRRSLGKRDFKFVLRWPGYSGMDWSVSISILDANQEAVTREELAYRVAVQYHNFALLCSLNPRFGSPQSLLWKLCDGGYNFDRMRLMSLNRVDEDVWVADVCVISDQNFRGFGKLRELSELEY